MKSIDIFPWNENFNTGLPIIDEQHQKLAQILNLLASHMADKTEIPALNLIFDELADYSVYHFKTEESIWHEYLADDLMEAEHKVVHSSFISKISKLKGDENSGSVDEVVEKILTFLTRWLASHILETDRHMAMLILAMQSGMSLASAKIQAKEQMGGTMKVLIEIVLSTYGNHVTNTLHLMKEIAERRQAQETQMQKEQYQHALLDTFPYAVWLKDTESNFLSVNEGFARIFGAKNPAELVEKK